MSNLNDENVSRKHAIFVSCILVLVGSMFVFWTLGKADGYREGVAVKQQELAVLQKQYDVLVARITAQGILVETLEGQHIWARDLKVNENK